MVELLVQILSTFALVLGVAGGEVIASKAFGAFKKAWMHLIEIVLFVLGIVVIFNMFTFSKFNAPLFVLTYFLMGLIVIVFIRGIMTGAGILAERVKTKILKVRTENDYIIGLKKSLERRGFELEEILKIAKEVGYKEKNVDDVLLFFGYKNEIKKKQPKKRAKNKSKKITKKKR